tara:strand:- start:3344 stop:4327 length:984 start_codon:yes stop_codon:yes gene_type:complete
MSVAIQLKKLKMFREWLEYQQAYDDRDEEAERWAEFIQMWENDKALNRLAESYAAEMIISYFSCPVCAGYCYQEGDTADCENCQIRWSVINAGEYTYLEAESEDYGVENGFIFGDDWINYGTGKMYEEDEDEVRKMFLKKVKAKYPHISDNKITIILEMFDYGDWRGEAFIDAPISEMIHAESEDYGVENVWMSESFRDWADDELRTHGENVSFEKWSQEEFEDEPAHRHPDGKLSFVRWARDEINEEHHQAEEFCSECGTSHKDAESFSAETADGNQVFNSCWKCGSGQHLNQISRYPASPQEIAGVGGDESQASTDWKSGRPMQR